MNNVSWSESKCASYEFTIELNATVPQAWQALTDHIGSWWLPSFHMLGESSKVSLECRAGGRLFEQSATAELLWYTVIAFESEKSLDLAGYCTAKFGGPATTLLSLELTSKSQAITELKISDSLFGSVSPEFVQSLMSGWRELFTNGLQKFIALSQ